MRAVTRNLLVVLAGVLVALLALGALPGFLASGDPYHVQATVADAGGPSVALEDLSERRFPYSFGAVEAAAAGESPARSEAYYAGPVGFKEAFTHAPFDEFDEFEGRNADAVRRGGDSPAGDVAFVEYEDQRYRLEIVRVSDA